MLNINDEMVMVGSTEFRAEMPKLFKIVGKKKVVVMNRGEAIGVFLNFKEYQEKESLLDTFEDLILAYLAKERDESASESDFLTHEEMLAALSRKKN